jgi:hypothetical protein
MTIDSQFVPKVHPLTRSAEPEDPLELVATPVEGDPDFMLQCFLEEFFWMGWDADGLLALFRDPGYPVLNELLAHFGEEEFRRRAEALTGGSGLPCIRATVVEDPTVDEDDVPELIQLSVRLSERD